jgi:regulator of protease activity HflC (stomatin/prohibitin superfamily)
MPRRSLRPHLNQIRTWVRQGRTDAWVAHQLDVTVRDIDQFKRQNDLVSDEEPSESALPDYPEDIDLRAEDDALIAAELEAAEAEAERAKAEAEAERAKADAEAERAKAEAEAERAKAEAEASAEVAEEGPGAEEEEEQGAPKARRRSRRGRGGRRSAGDRLQVRDGPLEGTFDHGEEGYGLWLDPAIQDNPIYAEHWAGHRPVEVVVEEDRIVIRRVGEED